MCKPAIPGGLARFRLTGFLKRGAVMTHYSDEHLIELFHSLKDCTLPRVEWTHAAHLGAAVCLLAEFTLEDAERTMPVLIRAYNEATGTTQLRHARLSPHDHTGLAASGTARTQYRARRVGIRRIAGSAGVVLRKRRLALHSLVQAGTVLVLCSPGLG